MAEWISYHTMESDLFHTINPSIPHCKHISHCICPSLLMCGKFCFNLNGLSEFDDQAKTISSFPVLVPMAAFCIGCIIGAFQIILAKKSRHKAAKKSGVHHHSPTSARWKTALSDLRDPESLDSESAPDSDVSTDNLCLRTTLLDWIL